MGAAPSFVTGWPRIVLRLEGAALMAAASFVYWREGGGWLYFAALFLAPDLSFAAYLFGPRAGAVFYNLAHATLGPLTVTAAGLLAPSGLLALIGLVWLAHVGSDRMLGYGLKYGSAFGDTHLGRIGR